MKVRVELDREADGRWIAEVVNMPRVSGVVAYGETREKAYEGATALALRVAAERIELKRALARRNPASLVRDGLTINSGQPRGNPGEGPACPAEKARCDDWPRCVEFWPLGACNYPQSSR